MHSVYNTVHDQSHHEAKDNQKIDEINTTRIEIPLHRTDQWSWLLTLVWQKVPNSEWSRNNTVKSVMNPWPLDNKSGYTKHSVIVSLSVFSIVLLSSNLHFPISLLASSNHSIRKVEFLIISNNKLLLVFWLPY